MRENKNEKTDWPVFILLFIGLPIAFTYGGLWEGLLVLVVGVVALGWSRRHEGPFQTNRRLFNKNKPEPKTKQYRDDAENCWRWARYETISKGHCIVRHSKPVDQNVSFSDASAISMAFHGDFGELTARCERQEHIDLVKRGTRKRSGFLNTWWFSDGSMLSQSVTY